MSRLTVALVFSVAFPVLLAITFLAMLVGGYISMVRYVWRGK